MINPVRLSVNHFKSNSTARLLTMGEEGGGGRQGEEAGVRGEAGG